MFHELGEFAPPYIVIVLGFTMVTAVVANIKLYQDYSVNIYQVRAFFLFPLSYYLNAFALTSVLLLFSSVANVFCWKDWFYKTYFQSISKICIAICAVCFTYYLKEYIRKYKEDLEDNHETH